MYFHGKTLEGRVVIISDIIAYVNHDLDDALRAGIISTDNIPTRFIKQLGATHSKRLHTIVSDIVNESLKREQKRIVISPEMVTILTELKQFLFENVYESPKIHQDFLGADKVIKYLYFRSMEDEELLMKEAKNSFDKGVRERSYATLLAG